jgi:hypothetical protein
MIRHRSGSPRSTWYWRISRSAVSLASEPPETNRTRAISGAVVSINLAASRSWGSLVKWWL